MKIFKEGIHEALRSVYDEFDHQCQLSNIKWGIEQDEPNIQVFRVTKCRDPMALLRHMANYIKDYPISLEVNAKPITFEMLNYDPSFRIPTFKNGDLYKFMITPIAEVGLDEDQYKFSTNKHGREQSPNRSSFRKRKTRDTYQESRSLKKPSNFLDRINKNLVEHMTFTDPEKLATINVVVSQPNTIADSDLIALKGRASDTLTQLLKMLEYSDDVVQPYLEQLAESYTDQINLINNLLESKNESSTN